MHNKLVADAKYKIISPFNLPIVGVHQLFGQLVNRTEPV